MFLVSQHYPNSTTFVGSCVQTFESSDGIRIIFDEYTSVQPNDTIRLIGKGLQGENIDAVFT